MPGYYEELCEGDGEVLKNWLCLYDRVDAGMEVIGDAECLARRIKKGVVQG